MSSEIILIGPVMAGKTTVGRLLAERLQVPLVSLDELRWQYYAEIGYAEDFAKLIRKTGGFVALVYYWKQYDAYAVERVLAEHHKCVFDFGAGHTLYESHELFARVNAALAAFPNVVLILPSKDESESICILNERTSRLVGAFGQGFNWHEHFIRSRCDYELTKLVVYTHGKTPEDTCSEILELIGPSDD